VTKDRNSHEKGRTIGALLSLIAGQGDGELLKEEEKRSRAHGHSPSASYRDKRASMAERDATIKPLSPLRETNDGRVRSLAKVEEESKRSRLRSFPFWDLLRLVLLPRLASYAGASVGLHATEGWRVTKNHSVMHLVPAPAVRLMKRRVQSRPGVSQRTDIHTPGY